ncbi:MAG: SCO family protein [Thermoleophilaceae bacterium]|nr:SCO family protein [Thermoleophilaceae bacterium]
MRRRAVIALFALGLASGAGMAIGLVGVLATSSDAGSTASSGVTRTPRAERFEGSLMPPGVRAPDFALHDQDGGRVSMRALRGRPAIVTFLYTTCEESCPAQAQQIKLGLDRLGEDLPALAVAVKPETDTPANAQRFLREQGMVGRMDIALGSRTELEPVWKGFAIQPQLAGAEHQARTVLIDARGYQRVGFPIDQLTPERLAKDARTLLAEARGAPAPG